MIFESGYALLRVIGFGILSYVALILMLRISGKRTLSKMNAFDLVITVAMGSTFATILLNKDTALVEGVGALLLLVLLQFAITWTSVRSPIARQWVKSEPSLLFHRGEFLREAMRAERVSEDEILAAIRNHSLPSPSAVAAVVLETDGTLSAVASEGFDAAVLRGVKLPEILE